MYSQEYDLSLLIYVYDYYMTTATTHAKPKYSDVYRFVT